MAIDRAKGPKNWLFFPAIPCTLRLVTGHFWGMKGWGKIYGSRLKPVSMKRRAGEVSESPALYFKKPVPSLGCCFNGSSAV